MTHRPPSAGMVKRGLLSVSDNLFPGESLNVGRAFAQVFRPELEARLIRKGVKPCATETSSPCRSGK